MKRYDVSEQSDLFSNVTAPPALTNLQEHHDELVDLRGRLLWGVVQGANSRVNKEIGHEQDQR